MIHNTKTGELIDWTNIPISTESEVKAPKANLRFYAETTLSEKIGRVFNGAMFTIAALKCLSLIPGVATGFAAISSASLLQIPVVMTTAAIGTQIIVALALIVVIRKILAVAICHAIYPVVVDSYIGKENIDANRWNNFNYLNQENYESRRIALNKSGINYDAFAIELPRGEKNRKWAILAGGNGEMGEKFLYGRALQFLRQGFNVLYVNGPGVGRGTGFPTRYSIGAGQEAGLQLLEKVVNAETILLYGMSLGGGAQGEAIQCHPTFKEKTNYIVWTDRSFDTLANAASAIVSKFTSDWLFERLGGAQHNSQTNERYYKISNAIGSIIAFPIKPIFFLLGIDLNGIGGAKKLQERGIAHIVTQNNQGQLNDAKLNIRGTDGIIPNDASCYVGMREVGIQDHERVKYHIAFGMDHNNDLPYKVTLDVNESIQNFIANPLLRK